MWVSARVEFFIQLCKNVIDIISYGWVFGIIVYVIQKNFYSSVTKRDFQWIRETKKYSKKKYFQIINSFTAFAVFTTQIYLLESMNWYIKWIDWNMATGSFVDDVRITMFGGIVSEPQNLNCFTYMI